MRVRGNAYHSAPIEHSGCCGEFLAPCLRQHGPFKRVPILFIMTMKMKILENRDDDNDVMDT